MVDGPSEDFQHLECATDGRHIYGFEGKNTWRELYLLEKDKKLFKLRGVTQDVSNMPATCCILAPSQSQLVPLQQRHFKLFPLQPCKSFSRSYNCMLAVMQRLHQCCMPRTNNYPSSYYDCMLAAMLVLQPAKSKATLTASIV